MSESTAQPAAPAFEEQPLATWVLRWILAGLTGASLTALVVGWTAGPKDTALLGAIGVGVAKLVGWVLDGIEARRGVEKKGMAALPAAARLVLWTTVTGAFAVLLVVLGALVGAGIGLAKGEDWPALAWKGVRGGAILGGGLLAVGAVTFGIAWVVERLLPPATKGRSGRWVRIDARAHAMWACTAFTGAAAAFLVVVGEDHASAWLRPTGAAVGVVAVVLALLAAHRASRPGAFGIDRHGATCR